MLETVIVAVVIGICLVVAIAGAMYENGIGPFKEKDTDNTDNKKK